MHSKCLYSLYTHAVINMKTLVLIYCFVFSIFSLKAQKIEYKITSKKKEIGLVTVSIVKSKTTTTYEVVSKVNLQFDFKYSYKLNAIYEHDVLKSSSLITYMNGKLHTSVKTLKKGKYYEVTKNGKISTYKKVITYSEPIIYIKEPKDVYLIYSEFLGFDKSIKKINMHSYEMENPKNGNISTYQYENGILKAATIDFSIMTFTLNKQ